MDKTRAVGLVAAFLAGLGVAVAMAGERFGVPFLQDGLGPALTLGGAALWIFVRARHRSGRG